jgi:hypothetical protein
MSSALNTASSKIKSSTASFFRIVTDLVSMRTTCREFTHLRQRAEWDACDRALISLQALVNKSSKHIVDKKLLLRQAEESGCKAATSAVLEVVKIVSEGNPDDASLGGLTAILAAAADLAQGRSFDELDTKLVILKGVGGGHPEHSGEVWHLGLNEDASWEQTVEVAKKTVLQSSGPEIEKAVDDVKQAHSCHCDQSSAPLPPPEQV